MQVRPDKEINPSDWMPFNQASTAFPGGKVSRATLHRWRLHGIRGVKLSTFMVGGRRYVSRAAIADFLQAQNPVSFAAITLTQRRKQAETANRILIESGI